MECSEWRPYRHHLIIARTGGLFLGGLSLWLLMAGLAARGAGSKRLWRLIRRGNG